MGVTLTWSDDQIEGLAEALAPRVAAINAEREDGLYDVDGAADFLCTTKGGIYALVKRGKLQPLKGTGRLLFEREALMECARG